MNSLGNFIRCVEMFIIMFYMFVLVVGFELVYFLFEDSIECVICLLFLGLSVVFLLILFGFNFEIVNW